MKLATTDPSAIRSIRQRDLFKTWRELYTVRRAPPNIEHYRPDRINDELPDLFACAVQYRGNDPRIVIAADSTRMHAAFGPSGKGQTLDEYMGPTMAPLVVPLYVTCIHVQRPVYTIWTVSDRDGRAVQYERLLLPFSDGTRINSILASLKAISEDGRFEVAGLMRHEHSRPVVVFQGVVDCEAPCSTADRWPAAGEIEFN